MNMTITKEYDGDALTVALQGRLDTNTSPELEKELRESMDDVRSLTLDLADLDYISSAGLRVLLFAHKTMSAKDGMTVKHVNEVVMDVFELTGFADILTIE